MPQLIGWPAMTLWARVAAATENRAVFGYAELRQLLIFLLVLVAIGWGLARWAQYRSEKRWRSRHQIPLETLALQTRLGQLAEEVQRLERGSDWARAHHLRAAELAYDNLLAEACKHAGITEADFVSAPVAPIELPAAVVAATGASGPAASGDVVQPAAAATPAAPSSLAATRLDRELALSARGWNW